MNDTNVEVVPDKAKVGRPLLFENAAALDKAIGAWSRDRKAQGLPRTITSLAVALNTSRLTLAQYAERDEFINSIRRAKEFCEQDAEDRLYGVNQVAGVIFSLKNNYGWRDQTEVKQDLSGQVGTYTIEVANYKAISSATDDDQQE